MGGKAVLGVATVGEEGMKEEEASVVAAAEEEWCEVGDSGRTLRPPTPLPAL